MRERKPPVHIGIIMDGNARWAKAKGLPSSKGYAQGVEVAISIVKASAEAGVSYLTLFLFSTENWGRSVEDISLVFDLFEKTCTSRLAEICEANAKIKVIGDRSGLSENVRHITEMLEAKTSTNSGIQVCLAMNYGGRAEIIRAVSKIISDGVTADEMDVKKFAGYLYTSDIPDPDLIIRTAGEKRLSNFLLWQSSYSEFYFCDTLWPDFKEKDLELALEAYQLRNRKYGK